MASVKGLLARRGRPDLALQRTPLPSAWSDLDGYNLKELLGRGACGRVFRAVRRKDCKEVAIKISSGTGTETGTGNQEFTIMKDLAHPNLVRAFDFFEQGAFSAMVLSYHPGSNLTRTMKLGPMSSDKAKHLSRQLLRAVDYLHWRRVVHSDVKSDNILVSDDLGSLHLTDFGASRSLQKKHLPLAIATIEFSAPEVLAGETPSEKHDIWGAGICMYLMLSGKLPRSVVSSGGYENFCQEVQSQPVLFRGAPWDSESAGKAALQQCLALDKGHRPAAMVVLHTRWLSQEAPQSRRKSSPQLVPVAAEKVTRSVDVASMRDGSIFLKLPILYAA